MLINNGVTLLWKLLNLSCLSQHSDLDVQRYIHIYIICNRYIKYLTYVYIKYIHKILFSLNDVIHTHGLGTDNLALH